MLIIPAELLEPGTLLLDAIQLRLLLLELFMPVEELINIEIERVIGKLLVRLDNAGHRIGHGPVIGLHLEQQQDQRTQ